MAVVVAVVLAGQSPLRAVDLIVDLQQKAERAEKENRWLDAAHAYLQLIRQQPDRLEWQLALRRSQQQDRITRRCQNVSYQDKVLKLPPDKIIELYMDVLAQIEMNYVEAVKLDRLMARGFDNLELALQNKAFLRVAELNPEKPESVASYPRTLRRRWGKERPSNHREAAELVRKIAMGMQQDLGVRPTVVVGEFLCAACEALDEYSAYLYPDRFDIEYALALEDVAGIGVELDFVRDRILIAAVAAEGPAERAGVQPNDQLLLIDGEPTRNLGIEEAALRLLGKEKTRVVLEVQGALDRKPRRVEVVRQHISTPSVTDARMVDPAAGIGYLHLAYVQRSTLDELDAAMAKLTAEGMRALILDLRGNPGGSFPVAVQIADRFISEGLLVAKRGRSEGSNVDYRASAADPTWGLPLVVLIDGETASASEVVAGAIKDHQRGQLIGEPTFGKSSIQHLIQLKWGSGMRLTTARFYSPLNLAYNEQRITPHILVDRAPDADGTDMPESMMDLFELQRYQFEVALRTARELLVKR
jgi:carboxyl-terminal processing protease